MRAKRQRRHRSVAHGQQHEERLQLSLRRLHPAIASPPHQTSHEAQPGKRHVTVQIRGPRRPASPARTGFSMFTGALQRLGLLEMKASIACCSKPAPLIPPPRAGRTQPMVAKTRGEAVQYLTATAQMLPAPAIHRAPTTAMTNFSRERGHSSFVKM